MKTTPVRPGVLVIGALLAAFALVTVVSGLPKSFDYTMAVAGILLSLAVTFADNVAGDDGIPLPVNVVALFAMAVVVVLTATIAVGGVQNDNVLPAAIHGFLGASGVMAMKIVTSR